MMTIEIKVLVFALMCLTCQSQSARVLTSCSNGTFWNSQRCLGCNNTVIGGVCKCAAYNTCDTMACLPGYFSRNEYNFIESINSANGKPTCVKACDSLCGQCDVRNGAQVCYSCASGLQIQTQMIGSICLPLTSACTQYDSTSGLCISCQTGYYTTMNTYVGGNQTNLMNINACSPCLVANCAQCDSSNTCRVCNMGYSVSPSSSNQPTCAKCTTNCNKCDSDVTQCQICQFGYYLSATNTCVACTTISGQCSTCTDGLTCLGCFAGNFLQDTKTCSKCPANCQTCSDAKTCTSCVTNYKLSNAQCFTCPLGCSQCTFDANGVATCTTCLDTYYLNVGACTACTTLDPNALYCAGPSDTPSATPKQVTQCQSGPFNNAFYLVQQADQSVVCAQSPNQCLLLAVIPTSGVKTCQSCYPNMYLVGGQCLSAPVGCTGEIVLTNAMLTCTVCLPGYYLDSTPLCKTCTQWLVCATCASNVCSQCQAGYYLSNGNCSQCQVANCNVCKDTTQSCQMCANGYFAAALDATTSQCLACSIDCATCAAPGNTCSSCRPGYIVKNGGCVSFANTNCVRIDNFGKCLICDYKYQLVLNQCVSCLSPDSGYVCRPNLSPPSNSTSTTGSSGSRIVPLVVILALIISQ